MAAKKKGLFVKGTYFDYPSLFLIFFLVLFGLMMVYSSSSFVASRDFNNSTHYLLRQFVFAMAGFAVMMVISKVRYQIYKKFTLIMVFGMAIVLLLVFVIGTSGNGSTRWIFLGPISFQPSEIAKLVIVLYMAHICTAEPQSMQSIQGMAKSFWPVGLLIVIIAIENLSTLFSYLQYGNIIQTLIHRKFSERLYNPLSSLLS